MNTGKNLEFKAVELEDIDRISSYTRMYGENSCQHSPVSMYSTFEKYGDSFCIENDLLYILRSKLCDDTYRVYLAPIGADKTAGFSRILEDASSYGKKVLFFTLTEDSMNILNSIFPNRFNITERRDLAEYVYSTEIMSQFSGSKFSEYRRRIRKFGKLYGERARVAQITKSDFEEIITFEAAWVQAISEPDTSQALELEKKMIANQLAHFDELHLSGVIIRLDGQVKGFTYGTPISDSCFDGIIQKGDRSVRYVYKVLTQEIAKLCLSDNQFLNTEEDLGLKGLRESKLSYGPSYLIKKYVVKEI